MTPKLTLNLGLRWDMMTNPVDAHNQLYTITNFATATSFSNVPHLFPSNPSWHNFDPRFGFAYDPFADHKTSIRGGFGIFHEPITPADYSTGFSSAYPWTQVLQNTPVYPNAFVGASTPVISVSPGFGWARTTTTPYMIQYNLNVQREIAQGDRPDGRATSARMESTCSRVSRTILTRRPSIRAAYTTSSVIPPARAWAA